MNMEMEILEANEFSSSNEKHIFNSKILNTLIKLFLIKHGLEQSVFNKDQTPRASFNVFKTSFNLTLNEMHFTFLEFQPSYR